MVARQAGDFGHIGEQAQMESGEITHIVHAAVTARVLDSVLA